MDIIYIGFRRSVSEFELGSYRVYYNNEYHPNGMTCEISNGLFKQIKRKNNP